jgi:hypothetical protein
LTTGKYKIGPNAGYPINGKGLEHHLCKYLRRGLSHEAEILPGVYYHDLEQNSEYSDRIVIPYRLCLGLILAAVRCK